jgi:hypothetical protein
MAMEQTELMGEQRGKIQGIVDRGDYFIDSSLLWISLCEESVFTAICGNFARVS